MTLLDKWFIPLYAPEGDLGADTGAEAGDAPPPPPLNEAPVDGPGSGRSNLRKQLEKSVETVRKTEEQAAKPPQRQPQKSRARQELEEQEQEALQEGQQAAPAEDADKETPDPDQPQVKAPEGWAKEAKAEWEKLSPVVQAAVSKREADMAKGVEEIKKKYSEIDQALQPRMEVIRRHGHTPAQAVNQLFAWFEALSANPTIAFPALAQSFKFDLKNIPGLVQAPQQQQPPKQEQQQPSAEEIPPYVKTLEQQLQELKAGFTQQLSQVTNTFQAQSQARTEENLMQWAKDKPHFEEVRKVMANLIMSQTVPPLPNGNADLDKAYDMALWAMPEVRAKVLADQQAKAEEARKAKIAAEKKAQQEQADKARRAAGSLASGAPGADAPAAKPKKGKSVRESIMEARQELSEH